MNGHKTSAHLVVVLFLVFAACSDEPESDRSGRQTGTPKRGGVTEPALEDWDGRHYDAGQVSQPRRVRGGWVMKWDRYGLYTGEDPQDTEAYTDDPVEPFGFIMNLTDYPFTNVNPRLRDLSITRNAWLLLEDESLLTCDYPFEGEVLPPWREGDLEEWAKNPDVESTVLLTFDKGGRVVQIRELAGC